MLAIRLLPLILLTQLYTSDAAAGPCTDFSALAGNWTPCYGAAVQTSTAFRQSGDISPQFSYSASSSSGALAQVTTSFFPNTFFPHQSVNVVGARSADASVSGAYLGESMFAKAAGNLAAGSLKTFTTSTVVGPRKDSRIDYLQSTTALRDQITVVIPKTAGTFDIGISMRVEGAKSSPFPLDSSGVQAQFQILSLTGQELAYGGKQYRNYGATDDVMGGTFQIPGMVEVGNNMVGTFDFISAMFTFLAEPGGTLDFANSAYISLSLPPEATFSSASGSFLVSEVPEPTGVALYLLGLMGLARIVSTSKRK